MSAPRGLSRISLPMLQHLLSVVERNRIAPPISEAALLDVGFTGNPDDVVQTLGSADLAGIAVALRVAVAERMHRPPPRLDLVWTGPETNSSVAKETGLVVQRLFESAEREVIVGGYTFDRAEILRPLHHAMSTRSVKATFFVDIEGATHDPEKGEEFATKAIDKFFRDVWTFGSHKPDVFYDPRTAIRGDVPGHEWATMHAKCIIVDDERSLITSANFTARGHSRNIEAGVLIEDKGFSAELAGHWRQLVTEGLVLRYLG